MSEHCFCRPGTDYCLHISSITSQRVKGQRDFSEPYKVFKITLLFFSDSPFCWEFLFFFFVYLEFRDQVYSLKNSCRYWLPSWTIEHLKSNFKSAPISSLGHPRKSLIRSAWALSPLFCSVFQTFGLADLCWEAKSKAFVCFMLVLGPGWNKCFHCFCKISVL